MAKISLLRRASAYDASVASYRMILEIVQSEDITRALFVNKRLRNFKTQGFDDVFVAVATPAQITDFDEDSPAEGTSFFRTNKVDLLSRNPEYLEDVFSDILAELQKLVRDVESLNVLEVEELFTIEADHIDVEADMAHIHYRIPLTARPSGTNEVYNDQSIAKHRVADQNTGLAGWLNCTTGDPANYKFKYNIAADATLSAIWPIAANKLPYAHLEVNGISQTTLLVNANGIFWMEDRYGSAPWPADYINATDLGSANNRVTLTFDVII